jgi:xanthine dehydrogenase YagS FAD-binding subunit
MRPFDFHRPNSVEEALSLLSRPNARVLAGGTSIVDLMKLGVENPDILVDIGRLPLADIALEDDVLRIGALASNSAVAADPRVRGLFPALSEAMLSGASGQIRNAATVGGNLLQRTRCSFFRSHDWPCNKRELGSGCPAREDSSAHHAVLGASDLCLAVHPSDLAVALLALDAALEIRWPGGSRRAGIDALYRWPGETPHLETTLAPGELIAAIDVPLSRLSPRSRYLKLRGRASYEFAAASVAAALVVEDGHVAEVAVALGGLGTVPWRSRAAEALLVGKALTPDVIDRFCDALLATARLTAQNAYKLDLGRSAIHRVLLLGRP